MPCDPSAITINVPPGPSGPAIPGFGIPFVDLPDWKIPLPDGFPEDLLGIVNLLQMLVPSGPIKASLSINFGKDIFDGILSLLDKFFPFLMLYKFFLPVLDLIICIIEVLCALKSPFAVIAKMQRLFRVCIPAFLALFPIFALIIMILSLLFLLIQLIEYIIARILMLVQLILANIIALVDAFQLSDEAGILAITRKLGLVICAFQNLFVLLVIFDVIIGIIKEMLKIASAIPPCDDSGTLDLNDNTRCCAPPTCPAFIKNNESINADTGSLQYFNEVSQGLSAEAFADLHFPPSFPISFFDSPIRPESWQFYDVDQSYATAFSNITNAYDLPQGTTVIFFPTDSTFTATTSITQAPYLVNLRLFYTPAEWDRTDTKGSRYIRINNCIVLSAPVQAVTTYNGGTIPVTTGVLDLAGGLTYEDDNTTPVLINNAQATLNTFIHLDGYSGPNAMLSPTDGHLFSNVEYEFIIQHAVLFADSLISLGCIPSVSLDRSFVNTIFAGNAGLNFTQLNDLVNGPNFPDVAGAQQCLTAALAGLASNISTEGAATFQATATACLTNLQNTTNTAISTLLGLAYDPYKSIFTVTPTPQFTSEQITVQVTLNETNGQNITSGLPAASGPSVAQRISAITTFGAVSDFMYDGYQFFNAEITSPTAGSGTIQIAFDGVPISTAILPSDLSVPPSVSVTTIPYTFVYSPFDTNVKTGTGDTTGKPRFGNDDIAGGS